jgi:Kef-type K+ transport system membrane component KefB
MENNLSALFIVTLVAVTAPLVSELPIKLRLPIVVVELVLGILVGPQALGWAQPSGVLAFLGTLGLAFLFLLAGFELDVVELSGKPLSLALKSWLVTIALSVALTLSMRSTGFHKAPIMIATALATTALCTLLPILRDSGELKTRFGTLLSAAGALGELGPILVVSLVLTREHTTWQQTLLLLAFATIAFLAAVAARTRYVPAMRLLARTLHATSQLPVRICILVLVGLVLLAQEFGLDLILGAFAAGMVVRLGSSDEKREALQTKLDAIGYGFLVPLFFVVSGMKFDVATLFSSASALLRVPLFLGLFLLLRGVPAVQLSRRELQPGEHLPFALYVSTALPLIVAITEIGVATGRMRADNAAALVGAGMLSVLLFPLIALALRKRSGGAQPQSRIVSDIDAL